MKKTFLFICMALAALSVQAQGPRSGSAANLPLVKPSHVWPMPSEALMAEWHKLVAKSNLDEGQQMTEENNEYPFIALGYHDSNKPSWHLRFEIMEVYPGTKYEDTVISELYFDGIDVH